MTPTPTRAPDAIALLAQARALRGVRLGDLAAELDVPEPTRLGAAKGWAGELLERSLGASAGNDAEPDFPALGVELKTIPLGPNGRPVESTWVTRVPLDPVGAGLAWSDSAVGRKLACVLWIPIEIDRAGPAHGRIGTPCLWRPDAAELATLQSDYEDLMSMILLGHVDAIDARRGDALQIRPKGRDASSTAPAIGHDGRAARTGSRGFYLRPSFTQLVLRRCLAAPGLSAPQG